jgi:hypothetical protein
LTSSLPYSDETRVGPSHHLQDEAVHGGGYAVAAVLLADRQTHQAGLLQLLVGGAHVGRRDRPAVGRELRLGGPVLAGGLLEIGREGGAGLQNRAIGADLGLHIHALAVAQGEEGFPVDEAIEVEAHPGAEVVLHGGISCEIEHEW